MQPPNPINMTKTWFITGCNAGLGLALAKHLLSQGYQVVGTVRRPNSLADLLQQYPDLLLEVILDVTHTVQIEAAIKQAIDWAGRVDVVVNNAGYGLVGGLEGMTMDQIRHQMETNFFGAVAITKGFLAHFRVQGGGRFLHVSSVAGVNVSPGGSIYSASKFALEGMSEGLMKEASHLNIFSTIIEPGPFRTDWAGRSLVYAAEEIPDYEESLGAFKSYLSQADGRQKGDPAKAAAAIQTVAEAENPPFRLPLGEAAYRVIPTKLASVAAELQAWERVGKPTDFDPAG